MHHGRRFRLGRNARIVRGEILFQRYFVILDAVFPKRTAALAGLPDANDPFQRIVGAAGGGQQGVPGAEQSKQRHRQRMGAAHELGTHQRRLGAHAAAEYLLQLVAAVIPDAVAGGAEKVLGGHAAVGEGPQHFQLVIVPDALHMGKLLPA